MNLLTFGPIFTLGPSHFLPCQISDFTNDTGEERRCLLCWLLHISVSGLFRSILSSAFKAGLLVGDISNTWHPTSREGRAQFNTSVGITLTNVCGENERSQAHSAHRELWLSSFLKTHTSRIRNGFWQRGSLLILCVLLNYNLRTWSKPCFLHSQLVSFVTFPQLLGAASNL